MRQTAAARVAESWGGPQTTARRAARDPGRDDTRVIYGDSAREHRASATALRAAGHAERRGAAPSPTIAPSGCIARRCTWRTSQCRASSSARDFAQLVRSRRRAAKCKWDEARLLVLNSESQLAARRGRSARWRARARRFPPTAMRDSRASPRACRAARCASRPTIPFRCRAHAGRQQPAEFPAAGAQGGDRHRRPPGRIRSSRARRRRSIPTSATQGFKARWSVLEINRNFGQSWFDDAGARRRAGASGARAERRRRDVLRAGRHLPAQLPRGALRGAAHRDHVPDVLPVGAPQRASPSTACST